MPIPRGLPEPPDRPSPPGRRVIVMVWDGLRPDFVTERHTPRLWAMARDGVRFADSHAAFPTVTRANAATITTGEMPAVHGIAGNAMWLAAVDPARAGSTGDAAFLEGVRRARGGHLLRRPALGERVAAAGGRTVVVGTGSPGSALLQHPRVAARGDLLLHPTMWEGATREQIEADIGPMPSGSLPNTAQNAWFTRAITEIVLPRVRPWLIQFWHTDPDRTQHEHGIGHPRTLRALGDADTNLGAMLDALDRLGIVAETDVIVTSDHGFSTITGHIDVAAELVRAGLKAAPESTDVIEAGGFVYVPDGDAARIRAVVRALQRMEGIGAVFAGAGEIEGTLSREIISARADDAPAIIYSPDWSDAANSHGYPGSAWSAPTPKAATHGAISPWDIRTALIAAGPDIRRGGVSDAPAGNTDIAPTVLHLLGIEAEAAGRMHGRVLSEALVNGSAASSPAVERITIEAKTVSFRQTVQLATVGATRYVDWGRVER